MREIKSMKMEQFRIKNPYIGGMFLDRIESK